MKKRYPPVPYHNVWVRIFLALLVAHVLMFYGDERTFWQAVHTKVYYISIAENALLSYALIWIVHIITRVLDQYFDWQRDIFYRIALQIIAGVVLPVVFAIWLATLFYAFNGMRIEETDYFPLAFPLIKVMIVGLNIYYLAHYLYLTKYKPALDHTFKYAKPTIIFDGQTPDNAEVWHKQKPVYEGMEHMGSGSEMTEPASTTLKEAQPAESEQPHSPIILYKYDTIVYVDITEKIAYFYCIHKQYWAIAFDGEQYAIRQNLSEIEDHYDKYQFFRINRQVILNRKAIAGYHTDHLGQTQVTLHPVPTKQGNELDESYFVVSGKKAKKFLRWLQS